MVLVETRHLVKGEPEPSLIPGSLRVYSMRFCPYAQRANLVLQAKKIKHDVVNVSLTEKPEWFFAKSGGAGMVPVIEVEKGDTLYESLIVAEYLDEVYPGRKLSASDPLQKAKEKILVQKVESVASVIFKIIIEKELKKEYVETIVKGGDQFEEELKKRKTKFFGGDLPGMVDYMLWPIVERAAFLTLAGAKMSDIPKDRYDNMLQWRENMLTDEAVKTLFITSENHLKYIKSKETGSPDYNMFVPK